MSKITDMAKELGQALGRTDEYKALKRAASEVDDDREMVELRNEIEKLEAELVSTLQGGKEPDEASRERYEELARDLQSRSGYQRLIAAQSNFDKLLQKVNQTISEGIREGGESRIIYPG
jgi:cell fate (sporulation/competence/biofilm development) regulator YlbF (YheA/YmcA/DUF963 family)